MTKRLEQRLSGKFLKATGIFAGLKIPVEYRGQHIIILAGRIESHNKDFKKAWKDYLAVHTIVDSKGKPVIGKDGGVCLSFSGYWSHEQRKMVSYSPLLLYIETEQEQKSIHAYSAVA